MWNYIFFLLYLKHKPPTELTANENYFVRQVAARQETSVFPIEEALSIRSEDGDTQVPSIYLSRCSVSSLVLMSSPIIPQALSELNGLRDAVGELQKKVSELQKH